MDTEALRDEGTVLRHKFRNESQPRRADVIVRVHDIENCQLCKLIEAAELHPTVAAASDASEAGPTASFDARESGAKIRGALALSKSVIASHEPYTETVARTIGEALAEVDTLVRVAQSLTRAR